jgi:hypothetical protein
MQLIVLTFNLAPKMIGVVQEPSLTRRTTGRLLGRPEPLHCRWTSSTRLYHAPNTSGTCLSESGQAIEHEQ